jgi:hypothetical protein
MHAARDMKALARTGNRRFMMTKDGFVITYGIALSQAAPDPTQGRYIMKSMISISSYAGGARLPHPACSGFAETPVDHFPTTEGRFKKQPFSKYPGGKIEFSRWITSGLSPFSKRRRSSRREAIFSAARLLRLMLLRGFILRNKFCRGGLD